MQQVSLSPSRTLWIVGASVRAAVESALRSGYRVHAADLFADADLQQWLNTCPSPGIGKLLSCQVIRPFPNGLLDLETPPDCDAWLFTGGLENHPPLVESLSQRLPLMGTSPVALRRVCDPWQLGDTLRSFGFRTPEIRVDRPVSKDGGRWLVKPLRSVGGLGTNWLKPATVWPKEAHYLQAFVEGELESATFVADEKEAKLLGRMRQQVSGQEGPPFLYRGSIGPLASTPAFDALLHSLGETVRRCFDLRGIFGVDYVVRQDEPWILEVNPRWTASCELFERAGETPLIAQHDNACRSRTVLPNRPQCGWRPEQGPLPAMSLRTPRETQVAKSTPCGSGDPHYDVRLMWGKRTVYVTESVCPSEEFVHRALAAQRDAGTIADIPVAGLAVRRGSPAFTVFASGTSIDEVDRGLHAEELRWYERMMATGQTVCLEPM